MSLPELLIVLHRAPLTAMAITHEPTVRDIVIFAGTLAITLVGSSDSISQRIFRKHLERSRFRSGVDRGLWRLASVSWPEAWIALRQSERASEEAVIYLRLDQYPVSPPVIALWDEHRNAIVDADQWPSWFKRFIVDHYPAFADIHPPTYTPEVLRMSQLVARRLRENQCGSWISSGDLTQTLERLLGCFRSAATPTSAARLAPVEDCHVRR